MSITQPHTHPVRVYWEDTDAGGIVYHASHIRFFERGRTEFLRALGVNQSDFADRTAAHALLFTVRRMEVDYLKPAFLDDLLTVETAVREIGASKLVLDQRLIRGGVVGPAPTAAARLGGGEGAAGSEPVLVASAVVTVVAVGGDGRPKRIPADLRARFAGAGRGA